jgi:16S rRNA (cytidine1402-2'-O)-methyltransferase
MKRSSKPQDAARAGTAAPGVLYMVATPIGNLDDMTVRAIQTLRTVAIVAAEDTRRSRVLLEHIGAHPRQLLALHDFNETERSQRLVERMLAGDDVAVVSDAGTPLVSDPGFELVRLARSADIRVVPIPGASALTTLLSASPVPVERFFFEGFLPAKSSQRRKRLQALHALGTSLVLFESPRRLLDMLDDILAVFGADVPMVIGKELTKLHEQVLHGPAGELRDRFAADSVLRQGEFVCVVGTPVPQSETSVDADRLLAVLADELPPAQAARIGARLTGIAKGELYRRLIALADAPRG